VFFVFCRSILYTDGKKKMLQGIKIFFKKIFLQFVLYYQCAILCAFLRIIILGDLFSGEEKGF
jgi:hypothetical protein